MRELAQLEEIVGARGQAAPGFELITQAFGGAENALRRALVGPEVGCAGLLVELGQPLGLCG
jgi:hypothetical protein